MRYILYKIAKKILLSILVICLILLLVGCSSISTVTIYDIQEYPDKYINKKVTIIGRRGIVDYLYLETTFGDLKGFWISDKEPPKSSPFPIFCRGIFVSYIGDIPSRVMKDKWERDKYVDVKITGIVRHKVMKIGFTDEGIFYIEGESWEYVD